MKLEKKYNLLIIFSACCFVLAACSKMDEYKKWGAGKEILYTGQPDSVEAYSGKSRVKLSWLRSSDPKVVKVRVYWNNRTDSLDVPVSNTNSRRESVYIENLSEGNYNFELFSYDSKGNHSVVARVAGFSYGEVFQKSLSNRQIESFYSKQFNIGFNSAVTWFSSEAKSVGVEITYKDNIGQTHKVIAPPSTSATFISDYNADIPISYRTMFKPDSTAIDTFYTAVTTKSVNAFPVNQIHIKNPGNPFKAERYVGRWGTPSDWIVTSSVKNHDGPVGGLDNLNRSDVSLMSFEYWGTPAIVNGKIYQTGTLPAGSYRLVVTTEGLSNDLEATYLSVARGSKLPDVENIGESLVNFRLLNSQMNNKDFTLSFTLTQSELLSLGVVTTMKIRNESSVRIRQFKLFKD